MIVSVTNLPLAESHYPASPLRLPAQDIVVADKECGVTELHTLKKAPGFIPTHVYSAP